MAFIRHKNKNVPGGGWINTDFVEVVNKVDSQGNRTQGTYFAWLDDHCFDIEAADWLNFLQSNKPKARA